MASNSGTRPRDGFDTRGTSHANPAHEKSTSTGTAYKSTGEDRCPCRAGQPDSDGQFRVSRARESSRHCVRPDDAFQFSVVRDSQRLGPLGCEARMASRTRCRFSEFRVDTWRSHSVDPATLSETLAGRASYRTRRRACRVGDRAGARRANWPRDLTYVLACATNGRCSTRHSSAAKPFGGPANEGASVFRRASDYEATP